MQLNARGDQVSTDPEDVTRHSGELVAEIRALVGDRFAGTRLDFDRGPDIAIIDLNDQELAAITAVARRLRLANWVRVQRVGPADLETWERLRHDLKRLWSAEPPLVVRSPDTDRRYSHPPVDIRLAPVAESTAADLHNAYGDFVSLWVGALPYPPAALPPNPPWARTIDRDLVDPAELSIVLEAPLTLRSGETLMHGLLLTNLSEDVISIHTNGYVVATIVDDDGRAVGGRGSGRVVNQPHAKFTAAPSETVRIPVHVGTASYSPELGYVVPAGSWHLTAPLNLADGRHLLTPALPLTIIP